MFAKITFDGFREAHNERTSILIEYNVSCGRFNAAALANSLF
jgi:hypothetical protein